MLSPPREPYGPRLPLWVIQIDPECKRPHRSSLFSGLGVNGSVLRARPVVVRRRHKSSSEPLLVTVIFRQPNGKRGLVGNPPFCFLREESAQSLVRRLMPPELEMGHRSSGNATVLHARTPSTCPMYTAVVGTLHEKGREGAPRTEKRPRMLVGEKGSPATHRNGNFWA